MIAFIFGEETILQHRFYLEETILQDIRGDYSPPYLFLLRRLFSLLRQFNLEETILLECRGDYSACYFFAQETILAANIGFWGDYSLFKTVNILRGLFSKIGEETILQHRCLFEETILQEHTLFIEETNLL